MRQVLNFEKQIEVCNAAALGLHNAGVALQESESAINVDQLVKNRDWEGLISNILKKGDNTDFSRFNVDQAAVLRGYLGNQRAIEYWRKHPTAGRDEINHNIQEFTKERDRKLAEIKRQFKLKDLK